MQPTGVRAIEIGESFHLPKRVWALVQDEQRETHPDVAVDDFSTDVVTGEQKVKITRPDPRCESGKRNVEYTLEFYVTVTIKGSLKKDPEKECSYKYQWNSTTSRTKARIKAGSYKEGDCAD